MKELAQMITRRRSVRNYLPEGLDEAALQAMQAFMDGLTPLYPGAKTEARIIAAEQAHFLQKWRNPQWLAYFAQETDEALVNIGFMYQQLDLYLQARGYGSCWVGLGWLNDDVPVPQGMKLAVMMAFGRPDNAPERAGASAYKRREMAEITDRPDPRLEVVRLAPSATNSQPWFITHEGDVLHVFREELGRIKQRTHGRMNLIDTGIALAHLKAANPDSFRFFRAECTPVKAGYIYMGSVAI